MENGESSPLTHSFNHIIWLPVTRQEVSTSDNSGTLQANYSIYGNNDRATADRHMYTNFTVLPEVRLTSVTNK